MRQLAKRDEQPPPSLFESFLRRLREIAWGGHSENADLRGTLEELIEEAEQEASAGAAPDAGFTPEERAIVRNALGFGELTVGDVSVPRADIRGVEVGTGLAEVVKAVREVGHSRLLVYRGTLDDVLGVVHVKDLLAYWGDGETFSLERATRPVLVVPPSMRVIELLLEMRSSGQRVAIVVDEFGGTDGLVTLEDLVSEIVGELHEKGDRPGGGASGAAGSGDAQEPEVVANPDGTLDAAGRADLEELEERLGVALLGEDERDEADTLGGLILNLVDRVPAPGEVVRHPGSGIEFEVLDADPRRIKRVRIRPARGGEAAEGGDTPPAGPPGAPA